MSAKYKDLIEQYAISNWKDSQSMQDYERKTLFAVVKLSDNKLLGIEKTHIETDFCFGYGFCGVSTQEDFADACECERNARQYDYFLKKNTEGIEQTISLLETGKRPGVDYQKFIPALCEHCNTTECVSLTYKSDYDVINNRTVGYREVTPEERKQIADVYRELLENKTKRCQTWWKKYGAEKLHTWTYLSD